MIGVLIVGALLGATGVTSAEHVGINHAKPQVDSEVASYVRESVVSGHLTIAGSDTMRPFLVKLAMEFRRLHPDMKIAVQGSRNHGESTVLPLIEPLLDRFANSRRGDGKTSGHSGSNDVQLLASSRQLTDQEVGAFVARFGYPPTAIPIAQDAVAIYVHRSNPIPGLTLQQADAIFSKTRKRGMAEPITTWGQLGLPGEWATAPVHPFGRDLRSSGTLPFFKQIVLLDGEFKPGVSMQPGSASVVLSVSNDSFGIGYSGIGFQSSQVRVVPLAEDPGHPYIMPTRESVRSRAYPLSRPLYLYVNRSPKKPLDPTILEFLKFANSREGQQTIASAGVYPVAAAQVAKNLELLGQPIHAASVALDRTSSTN
ncbi:MAG: PstS family phosphate ABC transporter substrate-binding protein [Nitrospiraceae bacterium]